MLPTPKVHHIWERLERSTKTRPRTAAISSLNISQEKTPTGRSTLIKTSHTHTHLGKNYNNSFPPEGDMYVWVCLLSASRFGGFEEKPKGIPFLMGPLTETHLYNRNNSLPLGIVPQLDSLSLSGHEKSTVKMVSSHCSAHRTACLLFP